MKICIFARDSAYGGVVFAASAMRAMGLNVSVVFANAVRHDFDEMVNPRLCWDREENRPAILKALDRADHLIVFGCNSIEPLYRIINGREKCILGHWGTNSVVVTDSIYARDPERFNMLFKMNRTRLHVMPDLACYLDQGQVYTPFYPYLGLEDYPIEKTRAVTIAHSPGRKLGNDMKGTSLITSKIAELGMPDQCFRVLSGLDWHECVRAKSFSHIFVDQLIDNTRNIIMSRINKSYQGGIGKSGIEAMLLKNVVISSGVQPDTLPHFPPPPVEWVSLETFSETVREYMMDKPLREVTAEAQYSWARKYLSRDAVIDRLLAGIV